MIDPKEINSLIKLLDDPDREIFEHIHDKLLSYGGEAIEYLESAWEQAFDAIQQERIANLVHEIQFRIVKEELKLWYQGGAFDLLQGVLTINKYQYPDLNFEKENQDRYCNVSSSPSGIDPYHLRREIILSGYRPLWRIQLVLVGLN